MTFSIRRSSLSLAEGSLAADSLLVVETHVLRQVALLSERVIASLHLALEGTLSGVSSEVVVEVVRLVEDLGTSFVLALHNLVFSLSVGVDVRVNGELVSVGLEV